MKGRTYAVLAAVAGVASVIAATVLSAVTLQSQGAEPKSGKSTKKKVTKKG